MIADARIRSPQRDGADPLGAYEPGRGSLFTSALGVLVTDGIAARGTVPRLPDAIAELLAGQGPEAIAVGAVPFDLGRPAQVHRPERWAWHPAAPPVLAPAVTAGGLRLSPVTPPEEYARAVEHVVELLRRGEADKVVLARAVDVVADAPLDLGALVARLARDDPRAYTFAVDVSGAGRTRTLLGASPELLVARRGDVVTAGPLAGSAARSPDPAVDQRRARELLASEKDRHEHALVVAAVREALAPLCRSLQVPASPSLVSTRAMWHLGTRVHGRLADPAVTSADLALALHPTPATCGTPRAAAADVIARMERFDRELYAGAVGWQDARGDGEWAVAIRCAVAEGRSLRLYAGAGIVPGSSGPRELAETTAKLATLLSVLGLEAGA